MAINFISPRLALSIQTSNNFKFVFINSFKSQFIISKNLLNTNHTYKHAQIVIILNKILNFFIIESL